MDLKSYHTNIQHFPHQQAMHWHWLVFYIQSGPRIDSTGPGLRSTRPPLPLPLQMPVSSPVGTSALTQDWRFPPHPPHPPWVWLLCWHGSHTQEACLLNRLRVCHKASERLGIYSCMKRYQGQDTEKGHQQFPCHCPQPPCAHQPQSSSRSVLLKFYGGFMP